MCEVCYWEVVEPLWVKRERKIIKLFFVSLLTENGHVLDVLLFQLVSTRGDSYVCLFSDNPNDDPDPSKINHVMKFCVLC